MPTAATHHRPAVVSRRSSSHSRTSSSSTSSLGKKGGFGGGLGMTSGGVGGAEAGAMPPPKIRKRSTGDASSLHSNHHSAHHARLTSHRSETHIPRLGALQRTASTTTIIDDQPDQLGTSAPARHGGLMDASRTKKSNSREAVLGDEEGWESNSDDGAAEGSNTKVKKTTNVSGGSGRARANSAASNRSRKASNLDAHHQQQQHPPAATPVQRASKKEGGAVSMFRIHSSSSDVRQTQTNGTSPVRQSFVVPPSSMLNGGIDPVRRDHSQGGSPTPPITHSSPGDEQHEEDVDAIPTPRRSAAVRAAASSSSLSAQILRHSSVANANGLHPSVTAPSPASAANRAAPAVAAQSSLASIPQQQPPPPPKKTYLDLQVSRQGSRGSDRSASSSNPSTSHRRTHSGHFHALHAPAPQVNPPAQLLTSQPNLHPAVIPAADPHPSPPSSVDTATIVGIDEQHPGQHEGNQYNFPTTESPTNGNILHASSSSAFPHHQEHAAFPSIRGTRPPQLRTASSRSSLNSFTGSRGFAPRRLVSISSTGADLAPPQLSSDYASATNPSADSAWPLSSSPDVDSQSLTASRAGGSRAGDSDAMGHLRKASFSSLRGPPSGSAYGKMSLGGGGDLRESRDRTTSMASLRSVEGAYDADSRSGGGRFNGATSAMAALRSSTAELKPQDTNGRSRLTTSSSSTSLAEGLKRSILGGFKEAFLPPSNGASPANGGGGHTPRSASLYSTPSTAATAAARTQYLLNNSTNAALVSHFQRQPALPPSKEWKEGMASLHPSPFLESHRALLKAMGEIGQRKAAGRNGAAVERTPMALSLRRCEALKAELSGRS